MVGSDANFGGRKAYFEGHGIDHIYDVFTAREDGVIAPDYSAWWGMEDSHLYRYAQQELLEISAKDQPFAFFMLTVDSHHIGGYICPYCEDSYTYQYENVLACASRQLFGFLEWLQAQEFYEDTSIVIVGDHPTMDNEYIITVGAEDFPRCIYNCFINSSVQPSKSQERVAFSMDMFPTTLASMGCTIAGDRLGLGTNLFSDIPTLGEIMNVDNLNNELAKGSSYYTKEFFFDN
jgi:phosphoglycerol transferase